MEQLERSEIERRDELALHRTHLANERTLLAYIRTALALAGAGAGMIGLWESRLALPLGTILILAAAVLLAWGSKRYHRRRADFEK